MVCKVHTCSLAKYLPLTVKAEIHLEKFRLCKSGPGYYAVNDGAVSQV